MPKLTLSRLKALPRKTQIFAAIALVLGLGVVVLLVTQSGNQPHGVSKTKQVSKTQKTAVLGAATDTATAEVSAADVSEPAATGSSTHQQASTDQHAATGGSQDSVVPSDPAPVPAPKPADPCDKIVAGPVKSYTDENINISFVESVTIPVGCTAGPFTVKTTDGRNVLFYGFSNKPTSPVRGVMDFPGTSTASSANYTVVITDAATPGYYEDFAYVEDPSLSIGGFAVTVKINVIPR